jgi:DNA-binding response OmpR family regulator
MRLLIVEDDALLADGLREGLLRSGFTVDHLGNAEQAEIQFAAGEVFDLAIVDLGLPGRDGLSLIRSLRGRGLTLPVLILTARDALEDCVKGLEAGADDYMSKPFRLPELIARVRALIRRAHAVTSTRLRHGSLELDTAAHTASLAGAALELTQREWAILELLLLESPKVVSKDRLLQSLAGWDKEMTPNAVEVHVSRLRAKLADAAIDIRTVRGIGYRVDGARD